MSRKQKRFTSLFDVDAEIFKLKRKAKLLQAQADQMETEAGAYNRMSITAYDAGDSGGGQYHKEAAEWQKEKAIAVKKHINAINETHIPRLIHTRAALQTMPMAFIDPKEGVTLEP